MNQPRVNITLVPSEEMEKGKEHEAVRLPKKVRTKSSPKRRSISVLGKKLYIHQAYKSDIDRVKEEKKLKKIPIVGFVSKQTFISLCGKDKKEESGWLSETAEPLQIGCDPEFVLLGAKTKQYIYADNEFEYGGSFGSDGPCQELRPKASTNIEDIIKELEDLIVENRRDDLIFLGGSTHITPERVYGIGGHISIGRIEDIKKENTQDVFSYICRILNNIIGLPLYRIERPSPWLRRADDGYGTYEDFRPHNKRRMEYRVPGGFWLVHPSLARAVLASTKAATEALYNLYAENGYKDKFLQGEIADEHITKVAPYLFDTEIPAREALDSISTIYVSRDLAKKACDNLKELCASGNTYHEYQSEVNSFCEITTRQVNCSLVLTDNWGTNKSLILK